MNNFSPNLSRDSSLGRNAVRLAIVFMVAASLAVLIFAYVAVQTGAWQAYAVVVAFVGFFAVEALVVRFARQNRSETSGVLLIAGVCYIVFAMTALMEGIGLALGIALALVIVEIVFETLTGPLATRARLAGFAFAIGILLMDRFVSWNRPSFDLVQNAIPTIAAGTVSTIAVFMLWRLFTWRDLSLARKLLASYSLLALLSLVVGVVAYIGLNGVQNSYERAIADGEEMNIVSLHIRGDLGQARQLEKDFLIRWQAEGFDAAYINYIVPQKDVLVEVQEHLGELRQFSPSVESRLGATYSQAQFETDLTAMAENLDSYDLAFQKTLQLLEERGFQDTGLEGKFRVAVHDIEDRIYDREGLEPLVITMLQIRRHEKDYLLRGDQTYIDQTHQSVIDLKQQIAASDRLETAEKKELTALADEYVASFDALVGKDIEIAAATEEFQASGAAMAPLADKFAAAGQELSNLEVASAQTNSTQTSLYSFITLIAVLMVAVFLSLTLSRQITRPVRLLTDSAQELSSGNYDAYTEVTSGDEIGTLTGVFNTMAQRLKQSVALVTKRAAELQTVATISTTASTVLDIQLLLQTVVDLTRDSFELYHSHIYLLNEAEDTLVLTAGAGEVGRQMVSEKRTIALSREHSLVARAARTGEGAIVNDVTTEPDFLPHPLLPDTRSEMAIPMIVGKKIIGVFDVQANITNRFTEEDVRIKTTLAAQVAVALQNARSLAAARQRAEDEALIRSIGQNIQRTTSIESALQIVARELGRALGTTETRVILNTPQKASHTVFESNKSNGNNGSSRS